MMRFVLAASALAFSLNGAAELRVKSAGEVCSILSDTRLRASEWTRNPDGKEGCWSPARLIAPTAKDGNTLAFSAEGASSTPERLSLVLKVSSPADDDSAKRELVKATKRLSVRALGLSIPHSIEETIMKGQSAKFQVGAGAITVARTTPSKGSYQVTVVMQ
ncbi:hypothetical protein ACYZT4_07325 [Pseudomonas sp. GB2N2]